MWPQVASLSVSQWFLWEINRFYCAETIGLKLRRNVRLHHNNHPFRKNPLLKIKAKYLTIFSSLNTTNNDSNFPSRSRVGLPLTSTQWKNLHFPFRLFILCKKMIIQLFGLILLSFNFLLHYTEILFLPLLVEHLMLVHG